MTTAPPAVLRARQKRIEARVALIRATLAEPRPAFPPAVHEFAPSFDVAAGPATQCGRWGCWGWRDDPRHLTPIPSADLES